jgi:hypothetical protein
MLKSRDGNARTEQRSFGVGLHTDQQSLILGEMMTARNKLQDENQKLRDKLQDAEMLIRMLHLKLEEATGEKVKIKKLSASMHANSAAVDNGNLKARVSSALDWKAKRGKPTNKASSRKRDAFRNDAAPGRKTFETTSKSSDTSTTNTPCGANSFSPSTSPRGGPTESGSHGVSSSLSPGFSTGQISPNDSSSKKTEYMSLGTTSSKTRQGITPSPHHQHSVISKLAQVVLNEYSNAEDKTFGFE